MKKFLLGATVLAVGILVAATPTVIGDVLRLANVAFASFPAAAADNEGGLLYDATSNIVKFSDGASWAELGGAPQTPTEYSATDPGGGFHTFDCWTTTNQGLFYAGESSTACNVSTGTSALNASPFLGPNGKTMRMMEFSVTTASDFVTFWSGQSNIYVGVAKYLEFWAKSDTTSSMWMCIGFGEGGCAYTNLAPSAGSLPAATTHGTWMWVDTSADPDWQCCAATGNASDTYPTNYSCTDTGIAFDTSWHFLRVETTTDATQLPASVKCTVDGVTTTHTTKLPSATTDVSGAIILVDSIDNVGTKTVIIPGAGGGAEN
jgi:hypothetical protein